MFKRYDIPEVTVIQNSVLTPVFVQILENRISDLGEELIMASYNRSDPDFFNKICRCQGQIAELRSLIATSIACQEILNPNPDSSSST